MTLPNRGVGAIAARRAVVAEGDVRLTRPAVVVELRPEPTIAVDARNGGLGDLLATRLPDTRVARDLDDCTATPSSWSCCRTRTGTSGSEKRRRSSSQRRRMRSSSRSGCPSGVPSGAAGYVATHGAAKVNVEAAVDRLVSG